MKYRSVDEKYMVQALSLAKKGIGYTSPNPTVGCIIVKDGRIIARAYHHKAGQAHAEILALHQAGDNARGADLYVTLEPCCIYGKTPPCTDALIGSGVKRIVIGTLDPNPKVNGRGAEILHKGGIEVKVGVLEPQCRKLNRGYNKYISTGLPFVTIKLAQSLDGRIATRSGSSKWISSPESRKFAHKLRASHDAILVGAITANDDNPQLTVRNVRGKNPTRIILTGRGKIRNDLRIIKDNEAPVIFASSKDNLARLKKKISGEADLVAVPLKGNGFNLRALLKKLGGRGITSLLVEGGSITATGFLKQGLADEIIVITAPIIIGEGISAVGELNVKRIAGARKLSNVESKKIGSDFVITGDLL